MTCNLFCGQACDIHYANYASRNSICNQKNNSNNNKLMKKIQFLFFLMQKDSIFIGILIQITQIKVTIGIYHLLVVQLQLETSHEAHDPTAGEPYLAPQSPSPRLSP